MIKRVSLTRQGYLPRRVQLALVEAPSGWSLWRADKDFDTLLVGWDGAVDGVTHEGKQWNVHTGGVFYSLTSEQADACVMAAIAFSQPEQWYRFAKRLVGQGETT